jgi:hypothetical protein
MLVSLSIGKKIPTFLEAILNITAIFISDDVDKQSLRNVGTLFPKDTMNSSLLEVDSGASCRKSDTRFLLNIKHYTSEIRVTFIGNCAIVLVIHQCIEHSGHVTLYSTHVGSYTCCSRNATKFGRVKFRAL